MWTPRPWWLSSLLSFLVFLQLLNEDQQFAHHKKDFLYLDPPYYLEKDNDNKMHKGMYPMKNIDVHHSGFNHELLRDLLLKHEGDFGHLIQKMDKYPKQVYKFQSMES